MRHLAATSARILAALAAIAGSSSADFITVKSDATTLAASTGDLARLSSGNASGLTFVAADPSNEGSNTSAPTGAPTGTLTINIPPGNGQSGFFESIFTLPSLYSAISLAGAGNVDDEGAVYLNGHLISGALQSSTELNQFDSRTFSTSIAAYFVAGQNVLLVADDNSGGGPSGAAYFATISYTNAVPEPSSLALCLVATLGLFVKSRMARPHPRDLEVPNR